MGAEGRVLEPPASQDLKTYKEVQGINTIFILGIV